MIALNIEEIILACGAKSFGIDRAMIISSISTDSRTISMGDMFIALSGNNFDGNVFAPISIEKGASVVIVDRLIENLPKEKVLLVDDTRQALLKIAGLVRSKLNTKIVGVTGSVGKTTTKEMIALILETDGKTFKTWANLNNEIGLAHMLLNLDNSYKYAVLEVGIDGIGQMEPMTKALKPNIAVLTNIGEAHLEAFKTKKNTAKEKLILTNFLDTDDTALLNGDDDYLNKKKSRNTIFYGLDEFADFRVENIEYEKEISRFDIVYNNKKTNIRLPVIGKHNIYNATCAFAVGVKFGLDADKMAMAFLDYHVEGMRQKLVRFKKYTVVEDCYNASPSSMKAATDTLVHMQTSGRKIMVISDMLELGENELKYHKEVSNYIAEKGIDMLLCIGKLSCEAAKSVKLKTNTQIMLYVDKNDMADYLKKHLKADDIVWFKASRGMKLEEVINLIYKGA